MSKLNLLIVENDELNVKLYESQVERYNKRSKSLDIECFIKKDLSSGLEALDKEHYDAAIVDLKLSQSTLKAEGNEILLKIKDTKRFPVFIISGFVDDLDDMFDDENTFFKVYDREGLDVQKVLNDMVKIYKTGITNILGRKGVIEKHLNSIFWRHLSGSFEAWLNDEEETRKEEKLLKYISQYLFQYLDVDESGEFDKYDSHEFYLYPSVRPEYVTGDLFFDKNSNDSFILLTPACDMVIRDIGTRNADKILLLHICNWNSMTEFSGVSSEMSPNNKKRRKLTDYMQNNKERYHFLPPYFDISGGFIDFQSVKSVDAETLNTGYTRIATVSPLFLKDIMARFGRYYSRQGQPDLNIEKIQNQMLSN